MIKHNFSVEKIRIGKKGQITIPKRIRDEDQLKEDDIIIVTHMPGGEIILTKRNKTSPEDLMLDAIRKAQPFDWKKAWREVKEERRQDR